MESETHDPGHALGVHKVSVTITRKTEGDQLVSQHSSQRWFVTEGAAVKALGKILEVFVEPEASGKLDGDDAYEAEVPDSARPTTRGPDS